ncbi:transposable element Tcb2 transposase [Trichonephila clavipes]|uniref:Transposable element Tcb2 transposase n=1 Tax=Trichonephila clavipes TaxID=2585209 RepID=A0A8X6SVR2_TRICX|nr:transposable element Tcb2 transposase [Trichonephila clavipes]
MDMSLRHFRRQFEQLSQFERGKIIGMMEAGWSARRVARQLGSSDCVVRRCWDQWIREMSFTRRPGTGSTFIRGPCVFSYHTKHLAEGHLGLRHKLRVLPLTPTHRRLRLEWCHARGSWTAANWNQVVFRDEPRFKFSSDDNRIRVRRPRGERLNPAFALQRHTAPTAGVMDHLGQRIWHPTSLKELEAKLEQIWNEMSQDIIQYLYASMPDRIASCIRAIVCSTAY